ncbi:hypothetical protein BWI93_25015 [Siphonobacter sp. BAB-5385]|uniref:hypothetical protein n=1 Tax=Siphonobacter sp. BAB-5385 TaxID=1864822 RepID=UPI000B9EC5AE|nr:hypothetical protein [Siphonobacter sp. BAB-5385]OZI05529.1 hypothetical protein BWI93_25015 [Siphonobacter sp. BAB-5385]
MNDRKNPLDALQPQSTLLQPATQASGQDDEDTGSYQALLQYRGKGKNPRFRAIDREGRIYGFGYAYVIGWKYTPPDTLSIYTTAQMIVLTGRHLEKVEQALLKESVKQLREFDPKANMPLPPSDEPLIQKMTVQSQFPA